MPPRALSLFLLLPLAPLLLLGGCGVHDDSLERIDRSGELRLITRNGPTTYYLGRDGERGFDYDLAGRLAQELGVELVVTQAFSIDELFQALERGEADIAAAGLSLTPRRAAEYAPSRPYARQRPQVIYKTGQRRPRSVAELQELKIGVIENSSHQSLLEELRSDGHDWLRWEQFAASDPLELLSLVNDDRLDVAVVDSRDFFIQQNLVPRLAVAFDLAGDRDIVWYLPRTARESALLEQVNAFLEARDSDGTLHRLRRRYFDRDEAISRVDSQTFVASARRNLRRYQKLIQDVARERELPWELLAAISYQESHWDPKATSPTGVRGMMMLTRATAEELGVSDRTDPEQSLDGGARYFRDLHRRLPGDILEPDRSWLALAAYNIGMGHLEDARVLTERRGGDPHLWRDVMESLPLLEDAQYYSTLRYGYARGLEAVRYVQNIRHYYNILRFQTARAEAAGALGCGTGLGALLYVAPGPEKRLKQRGAFPGAVGVLLPGHPMIETTLIKKGEGTAHGARPRLQCREDQSPDSRMHQRAAAHGAGLEGDVEDAAGQAVVHLARGAGAQRQDFRVRGGVMGTDGRVGALTDDLTIAHQHGAYGHLAGGCRLRGERQRAFHEGLSHGSGCPAATKRLKVRVAVPAVRAHRLQA
jgi:membrane-bound lytic murein transglycosylase F